MAFLDEFTGLIEHVKSSNVLRRSGRVLPPECLNLPRSKNWINEGKTTPVQNQRPCNCSYLMAALTIIESSAAIENAASPVKLSAQNVLECVKNFTAGQSTGCNGGSPLSVWRYSRDQKGLIGEASYGPYTGDPTGQCAANSGLRREPESEVDFWQQLPEGDEEAMKCRVAIYGPIFASIQISGTFLRRYKSGIWSDPRKVCSSSKPTGHAIVIVGYGSEPNRKGIQTDFWYVQNSWGSEWGQGGTFKIVRNKNLCGIGSNSWFAATKPKTEYPLAPTMPPAFCVSGDGNSDVVKTELYEKSLCIIEFPQNYEDTRSSCLKYGMRLYKLDSHEANSTLFTFATKKYPKFSLNVNGKDNFGCLNVNNNDMLLKVETGDCNRLNFGACEYIKIPREF